MAARHAPSSITYQATGQRRSNEWRLGAPVDLYHEGAKFPTVAQAERSARTLQRLYGGTWDINQTITTPGETDDHRTIAKVSSDALGRVWTDVMTAPGHPALL